MKRSCCIMIWTAILLGPTYIWSQSFSSQLAETLQREVPAELEKNHEPGLSVALIEGCQLKSAQGFGVADRQKGTKVTPDTIFEMGSISKTPAAWVVMKLVEEGKLSLDAPANTYLKKWKIQDSETGKAADVTIRRLLNHTAGISMPSAAGFAEKPLPSLIDVLNGAGAEGEKVAITAAPGTFHYSAGGYMILQQVVEDVTGKPLAKVAQEKIFKPLKMSSTFFLWNDHLASRVATPYKQGGEEAHPQYLYPAVGAAGLFSTANDMARFLLAHCSNKDQVLKRSTLESMWQPTTEAPRYGYGYELPPALGPIRIISHSGSNRGWKADFLMLPAQGLGIVVMTNVDGGETRKNVIRRWRDQVIAWAKSTQSPQK